MRIEGYVSTDPYLVARIQAEPDVVEESTELQGLARNVQSTFATIIEEVPYLPEELQLAVANLDDPAELAHMIAGALGSRPRRSRSSSRSATWHVASGGSRSCSPASSS